MLKVTLLLESDLLFRKKAITASRQNQGMRYNWLAWLRRLIIGGSGSSEQYVGPVILKPSLECRSRVQHSNIRKQMVRHRLYRCWKLCLGCRCVSDFKWMPVQSGSKTALEKNVDG